MNLKNLKKIYKNKKVLVTGHTGFKGSWLTYWLHTLGANVTGVSIDIPSKPSHFNVINLKNKINHKKIDIRNLNKLKKTMVKVKPDFVFHLAAQAIVKTSYTNPIYTWQTNTMGTLNVLESLRTLGKKKCTVVIITSDKSYRNLELKRGYHEKDILGGKDPYSASKASAELAIQSYISSFIDLKKTNLRIGIARAGNVIGGGDWSENRLIPDCVKSWSKNKKVVLRNPQSTRPWQHVLEAIWGYILLSINLNQNKKLHGEAFNFGPNNNNNYNVLSLVKEMKKKWKKVSWVVKKNNDKFYESNLLKLNSNKSKNYLKWRSILSFKETIDLVTEWYKMYYLSKKDMEKISFQQLKKYESIIKKRFI
jgi:CDP-glucose 4,6-dehydratase